VWEGGGELRGEGGAVCEDMSEEIPREGGGVSPGHARGQKASARRQGVTYGTGGGREGRKAGE